MRNFAWRHILSAAAFILAGSTTMLPAQAQEFPQDSSPIPLRRIMLMAETDLPGGDLGTNLDISLQSCVQTCLADTRCEAMTWNSRARACFPKDGNIGPRTPYAEALSGFVVPASQDQIARAGTRRSAAPFLSDSDIAEAREQARTLSALNPPSALPDDLLTEATRLEAEGDPARAAALMSQQVARDDLAVDWLNLARLRAADNSQAASVKITLATNAYLRASDDVIAARALALMADGFEFGDRGNDALQAMRLAAQLAPTDSAIAKALESSQERNGMRVSDTDMQSDSRQPRFCATMSRDLVKGNDYSPFLRLPEGDLTVEADGRQLCIGGLSHGQEFKVTLRAGLPAADGETMRKDVTIGGYVRDRAAEVRFPGRGYVLPASGDQRLSVVTVNADQIRLRLLKLSDRNLLRAMAEDMFATPLDRWQVDYFSDQMARELWKGTAQTARPMGQDSRNRDVTTSLAVPTELGPLEPGIYILEAGLTDQPDNETGLATQWFVISDFGISTYAGTDGLTVVVRSLRDASAKAGAEVALISRSNEVLAQTVTDAEGLAHFAPGLAMGKNGAAPALVTVSEWQGEGQDRAPRDMAFLSLRDPEFDLSDRGVEGRPPAPAMDLFVTTDRGAYRVGETVHATILARNPEVEALPDLPLTAVILRPDGVEQNRLPPTSAGAGGSVLDWTIPGNAPRGTWRLELRAEADGPALATARVLVEDFLPERIDFTPRLPDGPARAGADLTLDLDARWLFGAPAANLPVEGSFRVQPQHSLDAFPGYVVGRHDDAATPFSDVLPSGVTDAQGHFSAQITLPDAEQLGPNPVEADIIVNLREGAGRPVERVISRTIMPQTSVAGIRPLFEDNTVNEGGEARFNLLEITPDEQAGTGQLTWELNRVFSDYQWYSVGGQWDWEEIITRRRVLAGDVTSRDIGADISVPVEWGQYELVVKTQTGSESAMMFYAGWGAAASAGSATPDRLQVALDREAYRSGETAQLRVAALSDGLGVVSVLSSRVISMQTVALRAGDNQISLPVTDDWGAGVYVTVSAIRGTDGAVPDDRTPIRALGLAHAAVDPGARKLAASLEAPTETAPRGTIPVTLKVDGAPPGQQIHATIAAVDQGILNLTRFAPPNPSDHYFGQRRLGVALRDLYGRLILPSGAPEGALREGGDAASNASMDAPPPTEKLMSWFSGPLTVGDDGTVSAEIPVPDFNGEVRVMAVLWSETAIGQADTTVLVRDPVVVTVTAPPFLAPGDLANINLRMTHVTGPAGNMGLSLTQTGGDAQLDIGLPPDQVTLAEQGEAQLSLPISAIGAQGLAQLQLTLTPPSGAALSKDITISVRLNEPDVQYQERITLAPGESQNLPPSLTQKLMPGALVSLAAGPYGRLDVAGALARLERYPYGCTEQLTSGAMPLLYLPRLSQIEAIGGVAGDAGPNSSANANTVLMQDVIGRLLTRQSSNGGFGLWAADSGDLWLEAYVTDFLSRARALGHAVPAQAFSQALDNLRNRVNYATDPSAADRYDNAALAYALAVLARERAANIGDLRYYVDTAAKAFSTPMAAGNLGAALAAAGDQARADQMFRQAREALDLQSAETQTYRSDYGTNLRDAAALLALAADAKSQAVDGLALSAQIADGLDRYRNLGRGFSTQESIWTILAANALSQTPPGLVVNGAQLAQSVAALPDPQSTQLSNPTDQPIEVTLNATGKPIDPPVAGGKGYRIDTRTYDMDGKPIDQANLPLGTRFVVEVRVEPLADGTGRLLVNMPLPAGWEIDNPNLLQAGEVSGLVWLGEQPQTDMTEFRADRFTASLYWGGTQAFRLAFIARAVTPGSFRKPAPTVEDMYRPEFRAWGDASTVKVSR